MLKKLLAKLIVNFQPRMNLGEKRFNENESIERQNAQEREESEQLRVREERRKAWQGKQREVPVITGQAQENTERAA